MGGVARVVLTFPREIELGQLGEGGRGKKKWEEGAGAFLKRMFWFLLSFSLICPTSSSSVVCDGGGGVSHYGSGTPHGFAEDC